MENYSPSHPTDDIDDENSDEIIIDVHNYELSRKGNELVDNSFKRVDTPAGSVLQRIISEIKVASESSSPNIDSKSVELSSWFLNRSRSRSKSRRSRSRSRTRRSRSRSDIRDSKSELQRCRRHSPSLEETPQVTRDRVKNYDSPFSDNVNNSPKTKWGLSTSDDTETFINTSQRLSPNNCDQQSNFVDRNERIYGFSVRRGRGSFIGVPRGAPWRPPIGRIQPWGQRFDGNVMPNRPMRPDFRMNNFVRNKSWGPIPDNNWLHNTEPIPFGQDSFGYDNRRGPMPWGPTQGGFEGMYACQDNDRFNDDRWEGQDWDGFRDERFPEQIFNEYDDSVEEPYIQQWSDNNHVEIKPWIADGRINNCDNYSTHRPWGQYRRGNNEWRFPRRGNYGTIQRPWRRGGNDNNGQRSLAHQEDAQEWVGNENQNNHIWAHSIPANNRNNQPSLQKTFHWGGAPTKPDLSQGQGNADSDGRQSPYVKTIINEWGSEDECDAWGKKDNIDSSYNITSDNVKTQKVAGNLLDKKDPVFGEPQGFVTKVNRKVIQGRFHKDEENTTKQNTGVTKKAVTDQCTDNSDEDFGTWGNESKFISEDTGHYEGETKSSATVSTKKGNEADSDEEFGAWGSEQKSISDPPTDSRAKQSYRDEEQPFSKPRPNFQNKTNFNNSDNNHFEQRRGGPRNFTNNRPHQPHARGRVNDDHNDSAQIIANFPTHFSTAPPQFSNEVAPPVMMPSYGYGQPQVPQWSVPPPQLSVPPPQMSVPPPQMSVPPTQMSISYQQMPFSIDMSMCPPMLPPMPQQTFPPSMYMPPEPPFIPPPPPSEDPRDAYMAQGFTMMSAGSAYPGAILPSLYQSAANSIPTTSMEASFMGANVQSAAAEVRPPGPGAQPSSNAAQSGHTVIDNNLLQTLLVKAGLSSDSLKPAQNSEMSRSASEAFNSIFKNAASSVISRLVENTHRSPESTVDIEDNMSMSPSTPPPNSPPPARRSHKAVRRPDPPPFVPPPLPVYADVLRSSTNKIASVPVDVDEEKRSRADYHNKNDWQERVALEVKVFLKPAFLSKSINKDEYKDIMKRCVTKITKSGVTEIHPEKIEKFVLSYVDRYNRNRKTRQHSAVSSSEHDLKCD